MIQKDIIIGIQWYAKAVIIIYFGKCVCILEVVASVLFIRVIQKVRD